MTVAAKTRSIQITHKDGSATLVEEIPANAKITFGPVQPGKMDFRQENVLRIYTSLNNQLAVFRDVEGFRDLSLRIKVQEVEIEEELHAKSGPNGGASSSKSRQSRRFVQVPTF